VEFDGPLLSLEAIQWSLKKCHCTPQEGQTVLVVWLMRWHSFAVSAHI
jgi:hypothetical protein